HLLNLGSSRGTIVTVIVLIVTGASGTLGGVVTVLSALYLITASVILFIFIWANVFAGIVAGTTLSKTPIRSASFIVRYLRLKDSWAYVLIASLYPKPFMALANP